MVPAQSASPEIIRQNKLRNNGFTFVELLIATAIAVIITGIVFTVFQATTTTLGFANDNRLAYDRAVSALETLSRDLTCAVRMPLAGSVFLTLDPPSTMDHSDSALGFHTTTLADNQSEIMQFQVERVSYRLRTEERDSKPMQVLVREKQIIELDGTLGPSVKEDLVEQVEDFQVTLLDGSRWSDSWPSSDGKGSLPAAARLLLSCRCGRTVRKFETTALIRAGMTP